MAQGKMCSKKYWVLRFISDLVKNKAKTIIIIAIVVCPCILKEFNYTPKPYLKPYMEL